MRIAPANLCSLTQLVAAVPERYLGALRRGRGLPWRLRNTDRNWYVVRVSLAEALRWVAGRAEACAPRPERGWRGACPWRVTTSSGSRLRTSETDAGLGRAAAVEVGVRFVGGGRCKVVAVAAVIFDSVGFGRSRSRDDAQAPHESGRVTTSTSPTRNPNRSPAAARARTVRGVRSHSSPARSCLSTAFSTPCSTHSPYK